MRKAYGEDKQKMKSITNKIIGLIVILCIAIGTMLVVSSCGGEETPAQSSSSSVNSSANDSVSSTDSSVNTDTSSTDSSIEDEGEEDDNQNPVKIKYVVRAVDAFGNEPDFSVVVEMFKDGESVGEMPIRKGSAVFQLEAGEYTFEVKPMEGEFYYDKSKCVLTEEESEMTVTLCNIADETTKQEIYIYDNNAHDHVPYNAVEVTEGATYVTIDRAAGTYFLFTPTRGGIYKVSYESSKKVELGYYGSPHNVLITCPVEVKDGAFELEIKNEGINLDNPGGTTQIVIGISSYAVKGCILKIERIGNPTVDIPWTDAQIDKNATKADNLVNSQFVDFDVTNKELTVVYNEDDGYYHLNTVDGPLIYVRITSAVIKGSTSEETIYKYLPSFITMCETGRLGKVFYDSDNKIILKESYNEMLKQYADLCGTEGMYPLNRQLAEAIKNIGEHNGWFNLNSELHIFGDEAPNVVLENAWLFACAYENQMAKGTTEAPAVLTASSDNSVTNAVLLVNGTEVVLRTSTKATLTIKNANGIKIVANNGEEYVADEETGVLTVEIKANQNFTIVYEGEEEKTVVRFSFVESVG